MTNENVAVESADAWRGGQRALRLFLAFWPDEPARMALARYQSAWRWPAEARLVACSKFHVTLHFIGDFAPARVEELVAALPQSFEAFEFALQRPAVWKSGVAVLEPSKTPPELEQLHARLAVALAQLGLAAGKRCWRPHIALARRAKGARPPRLAGNAAATKALRCIRWQVTDYALVESAPGAHGGYRILHRFFVRKHRIGRSRDGGAAAED